MKYTQVLDNLTLLLNKKGRSKKGEDRQEEFKGYLKILKNDFNQEISTKFLFNLMKDNDTLSNRQKTHKIFNLTRGLNKEKKGYYWRGLEVVKYKTDVVEYARNLKGLVYPKKCELTPDEETQIQELNEVKNKLGVALFNRAEQNLNQRQNKRNAFNIGGSVFIKDIREEEIVKEFITTSRKNFNFIGV